MSYPPRRPRTHRARAAVFALLVTATTLVGCSDGGGPEQSVDAFLAGWHSGDLHAVGFRDPTGARVPAERVVEEIRALSGALADRPPTLRRAGKPAVTRDTAEGRITVEWALPGDTRWRYERPIRLVRGADDAWQVIWEPALVQERLLRGDRLAVRRVAASRAGVLDAAGAPIVTPRPVVRVGAQPSEVTDPAALARRLDAAFRAVRPALTPPVDLTDLPKRLAAAKPDAFVEVVTLREEAYRQIRDRIHDLPGTKFRAEQMDLAPTREFARALLGSVDPATAEDLTARPDLYAEGDQVGHGGLQGRYDERLRGAPGVSVVIERRGPDDRWAQAGDEVFRKDPQPGQPVKTTLDPATQNAADAALRGESRRSALVAVRISDGAVLAVANGPGPAGENLAFTAQVPPGSTFKMVSALGLLDRGTVTLDGTVDCPKTFTVDGRSFKNSENFALGDVPFRTAFAKSCNTVFAAFAPKLDAGGLADAGRALGLEATWHLGVDAFTGRVSTGGSPAERAAAAFGQGTTLVSPVAMAAATAAVARGRWEQPKLLLDPAPGPSAPAGPHLRPESVEPLRTMMREVVTAGTATALRGVPGKPVHGKTGTAEYDDNPANTHSWFVGWQGDVAFAVFVEKGGSSADAAVPVTARFLRALA